MATGPKIKEEPELALPPSPPISAPTVASSSRFPPLNLDDDSDVDMAQGIGNEDDEIVREIDVYLSPELSSKLFLMQFPLQTQERSDRRDNPIEARIRPRHCMVELDYLTRPDQDDHQDFNGRFHLTKRTFTSHTVPVSTHMTLGKMVATGPTPGLHLVPLTRMTQMRPNFHHVNEATMNLSSTNDDDINAAQQSSVEGGSRRPLGFQKKESERAALARKSSYSFKKASEESESWIPLEVHAGSSEESNEMMTKVECKSPSQTLLLPGKGGASYGSKLPTDGIMSNPHVSLPATSGTGTLTAYLQSLNYLAQTQTHANDKSDLATEFGDIAPEDLDSAAVTKMVDLMQQGRPMPYSILRAQFDRSIYSDEVLLQALTACAFLIRGNFVLQSRLLNLPAPIAHARTFILFLFQTVGFVHRERLRYVYDGDDKVTGEVILILLEQLGKLTEDGWRLKVEDDENFEIKYPMIVPVHLEFWRKQIRRFGPLFERYRQLPQTNNGLN